MNQWLKSTTSLKLFNHWFMHAFLLSHIRKINKKTKIVFNSHKYKGNSKQAYTCFQFPVPTKHRESNLETTIMAYLDRGEKEGE